MSISLRIIDVETGAIVYTGSAQYDRGYSNSPPAMAESLLRYIVASWLNPKYIEEAREKRSKISIKQLQVFEDFEPGIKK